ncbi:MAG: hypothetical protein JNL40_09420 [Cyclobacteriaceae bacterium]|nr:hypothetical protein [Cyclobacteriaceae bacterium]
MKLTLLLAVALLLSFTGIESPVDRLGVKGPLTFDKTHFKLAWTAKPNEKYYIQEYLPDGETVEAFHQMLTLHLFDTEVPVEDAVKVKVKELTQRKQTDPICNYSITESPDQKEFIVDFLLGASKGDHMTIVEFNIYRYRQIDSGAGRKALLIFAYSNRAYEDEITPFLSALGDRRMKFLNQVIEAEMPSVRIEGN